MDVPTILNEINALSIDERIGSVGAVWDNLRDSGYEPEFTDSQLEEIMRRAEAHRLDPSRTVSWEAVDPRTKRR